MAIDMTRPDQPKLNLGQAARYFPASRGDRPTHKSKILRYIKVGALAPDGTRVRLEAVRVGCQWITTPAAIQDFCEALTPGRSAPSATPRTGVARRRAAEHAARELDRLGIRSGEAAPGRPGPSSPSPGRPTRPGERRPSTPGD